MVSVVGIVCSTSDTAIFVFKGIQAFDTFTARYHQCKGQSSECSQPLSPTLASREIGEIGY